MSTVRERLGRATRRVGLAGVGMGAYPYAQALPFQQGRMGGGNGVCVLFRLLNRLTARFEACGFLLQPPSVWRAWS